MADITASIRAIQSAVRGEEVRDALINALTDLNNDIPVKVTERLEAARQSGAFDGEAGPQGPQGEQGPPGPAGTAANTQYDNTESGLDATDVQSALDELASDFLDGCDQIMQAVTAKGQTPASNSPSDIANAILLIGSHTQGGSGDYDKLVSRTLDNDTAASTTCTAIGNYAFFHYDSLGTVSFPAATRIGNHAFEGCTALTTVNFPMARDVGSEAFSGCASLAAANFPRAQRVSPNAFEDCTSLVEASFPAVFSIREHAFTHCVALASVILGTELEDIYDNAFGGCGSLLSLTVRAEIPPDLASSALLDTPSELKIYVPEASVSNYKTASGWSRYAGRIYPIT